MKAIIDRDGCVSCTLCTDTCPEVFTMADDGLAAVIGEVTDNNIDLVKKAAADCPVSVISIE